MIHLFIDSIIHSMHKKSIFVRPWYINFWAPTTLHKKQNSSLVGWVIWFIFDGGSSILLHPIETKSVMKICNEKKVVSIKSLQTFYSLGLNTLELYFSISIFISYLCKVIYFIVHQDRNNYNYLLIILYMTRMRE